MGGTSSSGDLICGGGSFRGDGGGATGLSAGERGGVSASGLMILGDGFLSEIGADFGKESLVLGGEIVAGGGGRGDSFLAGEVGNDAEGENDFRIGVDGMGGEIVSGGGGKGDSFLAGEVGNDAEGANDFRIGVDGTDAVAAIGGATTVEDGGAEVSTRGAGGGGVMLALGRAAGCCGTRTGICGCGSGVGVIPSKVDGTAVGGVGRAVGSGAAGLTKVRRGTAGRSGGATTGGGAEVGAADGGGGAGVGAGGAAGRAMEPKRSHGLEGGGWFDIGPDEASLEVDVGV